jgi:hypothetical protein
MGYGLDIGFTDHLSTPLRTTSNYSPTADLHNSQITTTPLCLFLACCVFNSHSLATASNDGDSSASHAQVLLTQLPLQKWQLTWRPFHTNLLDFSSQADFQLNCTAWGACYIASGHIQQSFYCCHGQLSSNRLDIISTGTCLLIVTKECMFLLVIVAYQWYNMLHCSLFKAIHPEWTIGI